MWKDSSDDSALGLRKSHRRTVSLLVRRSFSWSLEINLANTLLAEILKDPVANNGLAPSRRWLLPTFSGIIYVSQS
uniref:Uncharacterized protein n=1 Tax=Caenorhabditis japonica TaxID=281687 RepID=A0A8R1EE83_CAEJA